MPGNPLTNPQWAQQFADTVERVVGLVRDNATVRAVQVVRGLVFGLVIGLAGIAAVILTTILSLKLIQKIVNIGGWIDADSSVWVSYLVLSTLLFIGGVWCLSQRSLKEAS
ncbi:MAG: hypothetical protein ACOYL9_06075 [Ilumatobacteraceae bacterium]|jgi:hypothetical protein